VWTCGYLGVLVAINVAGKGILLDTADLATYKYIISQIKMTTFETALRQAGALGWLNILS